VVEQTPKKVVNKKSTSRLRSPVSGEDSTASPLEANSSRHLQRRWARDGLLRRRRLRRGGRLASGRDVLVLLPCRINWPLSINWP